MKTYLRSVVSIGVVVLLFIIFHYFGILSGIEQTIKRVMFYGSTKLYGISVSVISENAHYESIEQLLEEHRSLLNSQEEMITLRSKIASLEDENAQMRELLQFKERNNLQLLGAGVVAKNLDPTSRSIAIDRGENDGVMIGNPVVTSDGVLIGIVDQITANDAIVRLLNDNESKIAGTIQNHDKSIGVVEGGYGISVRMSYIPQQEVVEIGNIIVTSGLEKHIPYGLTIGTIESLEKEPFEPFQRALISLPISYDKLRVVSVILQGT